MILASRSRFGQLLAASALASSCQAHAFGLGSDHLQHGLKLMVRNVTNSSSTGPYKLTDEYNSTNFFDKFDFFESKTGTDNYNDVDPTSGFVLYQNRSEAERLGLIETDGPISKIKVDADTMIANATGYGRRSVRIESKASYNQSLFIGDFSYLPPARCGIWPAFWLYGPNWPNSGEIDIYEQWNTHKFNRQTLHTGANATVGNCTLSTTTSAVTNYQYSDSCDIYASDWEGCSTWDYEGPYASSSGGVYALEWTSQYIRMWTWYQDEVPLDIINGTPAPSGWGTPGLITSDCDTSTIFRNQSIVLNIDFCGSTAGEGTEWTSSCAEATGYNTCARYVAWNPQDFEDVWFGVRSIKVYTAQNAY